MLVEAVPPSSKRTAEPLLETRQLGKSFGHVHALHDVDLSLHGGEIVALVGDNGAGKSTLIKLLSGVHTPSSGKILIQGEETEFASPSHARACGIETVYQDLALATEQSIWANIFLGREIRRAGPLRALGWLDKRRMADEAQRELAQIGIDLGAVDKPCKLLSGGERQAVAVARAVAWGRNVVLMDEPTAALAVEEQEKVERLLYILRDKGLAVLLVSHNLPEVHRICDRIVVLRHGRVVTEAPAAELSVEQIVMWITGAMTAA